MFLFVFMNGWFVFAVLALLLWGLWGFFPKLATNYIRPESVLVYEVVGSVAIGLLALYLVGFRPETQVNGVVYGVLTGVFLTLGSLFFLFAISKGKASVVVTMTALYPVVTILLAFLILREPITLRQGLGILLALVAMWLFST